MQKAMCENGGCLAKLSGSELSIMLNNVQNLIAPGSLNKVKHPFDDCAVIDCPSDKLLFTTDQNPPVGHEPYIAGKIAALHAISDIYAMGGRPFCALSSLVLGNNMSVKHGEKILLGIYDACNQENVLVAGGHTIYSVEPIIGLSVIGIPNADGGIFAKKNCTIGDKIFMSKKLGANLVLRGFYNKMLDEVAYNCAIDIMTQSNSIAQTIATSKDVHALTDITGYGLLGHLSEMLNSSQGAIIYLNTIPFLHQIHNLSYVQMKTKYINANLEYVKQRKKFKYTIDSSEKLTLLDPQTNGGLLAVAGTNASKFLIENGFTCIGEITDSNEIIVR